MSKDVIEFKRQFFLMIKNNKDEDEYHHLEKGSFSEG
jgi:hypothetical protein